MKYDVFFKARSSFDCWRMECRSCTAGLEIPHYSSIGNIEFARLERELNEDRRQQAGESHSQCWQSN